MNTFNVLEALALRYQELNPDICLDHTDTLSSMIARLENSSFNNAIYEIVQCWSDYKEVDKEQQQNDD